MVKDLWPVVVPQAELYVVLEAEPATTWKEDKASDKAVRALVRRVKAMVELKRENDGREQLKDQSVQGEA